MDDVTDAAGSARRRRDAPHNRRRTRAERARDRITELEGHTDDFVAYFKERVYATFTGLAIVLVAAAAAHPTPEHALLALVLGVVGITAAGFVSDVISHLAVHQEFPGLREWAILGRIALGALGTMLVPGILIALAWLDVMSIEAALRASIIVYIATLGIIGWFAVRRSTLRWWEQLFALLILVALGFVVIGLQTLAHSVSEG